MYWLARVADGLVGRWLANAVMPIDNRISGAFDLTGRHHLPSNQMV